MGWRGNSDSDEKPEWNMALAYFMRLNNRMDDIEKAKNDGDLIRCHRCCRTAYGLMHWKVKEEGHEEDEKKLDALFKASKNYFEMSMSRDKNLTHMSTSAFENTLDEIFIMLNDLAMAYHLIIPKDEEFDWEKIKEKVEKGYA